MRSKVSLHRPGHINLPINFLMRGPSFTDGKLFFFFFIGAEGRGFYPQSRVARLVLVRALVEAYVSSAAFFFVFFFPDLTR